MILDALANSHLAHAPVQPQPLAGVIVVRFNGRFHLKNCLKLLLTADEGEVWLLQPMGNGEYDGGNSSAAEVTRDEYLIILNADAMLLK